MPESGFPERELEPVTADPDALPRPEEEVADAGRDDRPPREPAAGGGAGGEPAQGEGAPDSW